MSHEICSWVDPYVLARQVGEWDIPDIVEFVKDIDKYRAEDELSESLRDYFVMIVEDEDND